MEDVEEEGEDECERVGREEERKGVRIDVDDGEE